MSNKKLPPGWEKQNSNDRPNWVYKDSLKKSWNNNASNLMSNPNYKVDISEETKNIVSDKSKKNSLEEKFALHGVILLNGIPTAEYIKLISPPSKWP